ncbi:type VII secretion target [Nocardia sp. CDC153]|uniref:type VII secretion target n=1 Tax=Nocardia sp. CDC153 TaxID=3112167 RepID=UPI002DBB4BE3|nr:type VII secretion target [Nocardia sp. CDC153]MEC3954832.1 type VII secretion target [Nocardia sp. CDC153]
MHRLTVHTEGLATYAATTTTLAADVAAITTRAATATPDLLAPALGLIAADFLTAYTAAHATHLATLTTLGTTFAAISASTAEAASAYIAHDSAYAAALHANDPESMA